MYRRFKNKWKTISLATLLAIGGASLLGDHHAVHASVNTPVSTQHVSRKQAPKQITQNTKVQVSSPVLHQLSNTKRSINKLAQKQQQARAKFTYVATDKQATPNKQQVPTVVKDLMTVLDQDTNKINQSAKQKYQKRHNHKQYNKHTESVHNNSHKRQLYNKLVKSERQINQQNEIDK